MSLRSILYRIKYRRRGNGALGSFKVLFKISLLFESSVTLSTPSTSSIIYSCMLYMCTCVYRWKSIHTIMLFKKKWGYRFWTNYMYGKPFGTINVQANNHRQKMTSSLSKHKTKDRHTRVHVFAILQRLCYRLACYKSSGLEQIKLKTWNH